METDLLGNEVKTKSIGTLVLSSKLTLIALSFVGIRQLSIVSAGGAEYIRGEKAFDF